MTLAELAKLASPLDALKREEMRVPRKAPPEVIAVLGGDPPFRLPTRGHSHWMAQSPDGHLLAVPCNGDVALFDIGTGRTVAPHPDRSSHPVLSPRLQPGRNAVGVRLRGLANQGLGRGDRPGPSQPGRAHTPRLDRGLRLTGEAAGQRRRGRDGQGVGCRRANLPAWFRRPHRGVEPQLAFSPDGKRLATASSTCKVWDADNWREVRNLTTPFESFQAVTWSRDGKKLAAGNDAGVILWNADTYDVLHTLYTPGKGLIAFTPDGTALLTAPHYDPDEAAFSLTRSDVATGTVQATFPLTIRGGLTASSTLLCPDGRTVFASQAVPPKSDVHVYDATTGQERSPSRGLGSVRSVAVSPDGRTLASGGDDHTVRLWALARWRSGEPLPPVRTMEGHADQVSTVVFSPDGQLLASGASDGLLFLWDTASGRKVHAPSGHSLDNSCAAFSPDGRTVAAGGLDGTVNRWDVATGQPKEPWRWHVGPVRPVAYSPEGRWLASGGNDATAQLLDSVTGQPQHAFRGRTPFTSLAFSPDGQKLAAACDVPAAALRLWHLETNAARSLAGHTGPILGLAFHPAGEWVATASLDGTVRLWDVTPSGKGARTLDFRAISEPQCVAFTPEGRYLAVGLRNGSIAIARVTP